jgi:hypothetical protein
VVLSSESGRNAITKRWSETAQLPHKTPRANAPISSPHLSFITRRILRYLPILHMLYQHTRWRTFSLPMFPRKRLLRDSWYTKVGIATRLREPHNLRGAKACGPASYPATSRHAWRRQRLVESRGKAVSMDGQIHLRGFENVRIPYARKRAVHGDSPAFVYITR